MGDIKINVSGGNAQFGNVSQGDNNSLDASWQSWCTQENLASFNSALEDLQIQQKATALQTAELRAEIDALGAEKDEDSLVARARRLYEEYAWAAEPLKKLFAILL